MEQSANYGVYSDPVEGRGRIDISGVTFSGWPFAAIEGARLAIRDCTFSGNWVGVLGRRQSTIDNCTFTGHGYDAVHSFIVKISDSTISGNYGGVYGLRKIRFDGVAVENNSDYGFYGVKMAARNSSFFAGNCTAPIGKVCADLISVRRPRLIDSTCESSWRIDGGLSWGTCSGD